uniref:Uncharacterized protein n=1 Tax=Arcella intermedia TaxID=1963864 RepID=A0A6B2LLW0_9EUKA
MRRHSSSLRRPTLQSIKHQTKPNQLAQNMLHIHPRGRQGPQGQARLERGLQGPHPRHRPPRGEEAGAGLFEVH